MKRWRDLPWRTRRAKAALWLSGKLGRIRTRQKMYRVVFRELPDGTTTSMNEDGELNTVPVYHRAPCRTSTKLMLWGMHHDPKHWEHWGLVPGDYPFTYECPTCGGCTGYEPTGPGLTGPYFEDDEEPLDPPM